MFKTQDFFKNIPELNIGTNYGLGGAAFFVGKTDTITGEKVPTQMMLDHKNRHPKETTPGSNNNWYVPHQKYYYSRYEAQSGENYPTVPMFIKFQGNSTMDAFSKKFGFRFSGITR